MQAGDASRIYTFLDGADGVDAVSDAPADCSAWLRASSRTFHLTREMYPIAGFGGSGRVISSLLDGAVDAFAIMPAYDFLIANATATHLCARIRGRAAPAGRESSRGAHHVDYHVDYHVMDVYVWVARVDGLAPVFLLGAPPWSVWSHLWRVGSPDRVYASHDGFAEDDRDLWFGGAVTAFVARVVQPAVARAVDESERRGDRGPCGSPPASCCAWQCVSVQVHGALHVPALWYMAHHMPRGRRPTLVFTMHDYYAEFARGFTTATLTGSLGAFLADRTRVHLRNPTMAGYVGGLDDAYLLDKLEADAPAGRDVSRVSECRALQSPRATSATSCSEAYNSIEMSFPSMGRFPYIQGSVFGMMLSDVVTAVSVGMLDVLLEKSVWAPPDVLRALIAAQKQSRVVAINNGVDRSLDPFAQRVLCASHGGRSTAANCYAPGNSSLQTLAEPSPIETRASECRAGTQLEEKAWLQVLRDSGPDVNNSKLAAKWLLCKSFLKCASSDGDMPVMIGFVGRFEHNKGFTALPDIVVRTCATLPQYSLLFVILGSPAGMSYPELAPALRKLQSYGTQQRCGVRVVSDAAEHAAWSGTIRLGMDLMLIPSLNEAFGLVVAEALSHGAIPVASAVGGIADIIRPEPKSFLRAVASVCSVVARRSRDGRPLCAPSISRLLRAADLPDAALHWNGYLAPLHSLAPSSVVDAFAIALPSAIRHFVTASVADRATLRLRMIASVPRWHVIRAQYACTLRVASQRRSAPLLLPLGSGAMTRPSISFGRAALLSSRDVVPRFTHDCTGAREIQNWRARDAGYVAGTVHLGRAAIEPVAKLSRRYDVSTWLRAVWGSAPKRYGMSLDVRFGNRTRSRASFSGIALRALPSRSHTGSCVLFLDLYYTDGEATWGLERDFTAPANEGWVTANMLVSPKAPVKRAELFVYSDDRECDVLQPSFRFTFAL